jgi:ferredoxin-type protein NapH
MVILTSNYGLMYGTTCALTVGNFAVISPLGWVLALLGTKNFLPDLVIPGLVAFIAVFMFGRILCGWICPVGISLEYSHAMTQKERFGALRWNSEKYAILLAVLVAALLFNFSMPYLFSPPGIIYRIVLSLMLQGIIGADLAILVLIFVFDILAIRYGRTWCNTICPLGSLITCLSIFNLVRPKVDRSKCLGPKCLICESVCPMRIPITNAGRLSMMSCTKCLKCWETCPVGAIKIKVFS